MANKQSVPSAQLMGATAIKPIKNVALPLAERQVVENNASHAAEILSSAGERLRKFRRATNEERIRLKTAIVLGEYRQQLLNAQTSEEFEDVAQQSEMTLQNAMSVLPEEQNFWQDNRAKLIDFNRHDVENLRQEKEVEFGKMSLNQMLADNQNVLAMPSLGQGAKLIARGVDEITQTPFLDEAEKAKYRQEYLQTGVLNLALSSADEAKTLAQKYLPDDAEILQKITQVQTLNQQAIEKTKQVATEKAYFDEVQNVLQLWQRYEQGQINEAAYFVLGQNYRADILWGEEQVRADKKPLLEAYHAMRRTYNGEKLNAEALGVATNHLISAYRQNKIGLTETMELQNQFMLKGVEDVAAFDGVVNAMIDKIWGKDTDEKVENARGFMTEKARLALEFYEAYYAEKSAQVAEFQAKGGVMTSGLSRRFAREAAQKVRDDFGFKENISAAVEFEELDAEVHAHYHGDNVAKVWQRFYQEAPYATDKIALMKQVAQRCDKPA